MALSFKQIAWNGIQFSIPNAWELVRVDSHHLTFGNHGNPTMEIKWNTFKGRFSHRAQLKKITKGPKSHPSKKIIKWQLPPNWQQALATYSSQGFRWQTNATSGHGAILYCPVCKKAIILQMFNIHKRLSDPKILQLLKTLSDHREDGCTAWQVYDIQALLPKSMRLSQYRFNPGNHELAFSDKAMLVRFFRWAPASALLAQTSLSAFAADTLNLSERRSWTTSIQGYPAVEWYHQKESGWYRYLVRWGIKPAFKWVTVWHVEASNRILGISIESKKPFKPNHMSQLSDSYRLNLS